MTLRSVDNSIYDKPSISKLLEEENINATFINITSRYDGNGHCSLFSFNMSTHTTKSTNESLSTDAAGAAVVVIVR